MKNKNRELERGFHEELEESDTGYEWCQAVWNKMSLITVKPTGESKGQNS